MDKEQFCKKYYISIKQFKGEEWVRGGLTIDEEVLPEGFNPKVRGDLVVNKLKEIPPWFNPVVSGFLLLTSVVSFDASFNPVVDVLTLDSLTEIPFGWEPTVGATLFLNSITTLPDWFEPVAWRVSFNHYNDYTYKFRPANEFYVWRGGKYIKVDGITIEVVKQRGNVYNVKKFGGDEMFYLVTDGNGVFAHGVNLSEAKHKLIYKLVMVEGYKQCKSLTNESVLTFDELITMYRLITGACQFGIEKFIKENKIENKSYSIGEVIALTDGYYGDEIFKNFFTENLVD